MPSDNKTNFNQSLRKLLSLLGRLIRISARQPSDLKHLLGILSHYAKDIVDPETDVRQLPQAALDDLLELAGGDMELSLHAFAGIPASISPVEAYVLAILLRIAGAGKVFEFGTYKGLSTTQLALNIGAGGHVYTLDLPDDHPAYSLEITKPEERRLASEAEKGVLVPAHLRDRVTFLRFDSATFDESPYVGRIDFAFVDGAHSFDYLKNDSQKAWRMLKLGGILAWHDCTPSHRDVVRYLKSLPTRPRLVEGTALAYSVRTT